MTNTELEQSAVRYLSRLEPYTLIGRERERIQADEMARTQV